MRKVIPAVLTASLVLACGQARQGDQYSFKGPIGPAAVQSKVYPANPAIGVQFPIRVLNVHEGNRVTSCAYYDGAAANPDEAQIYTFKPAPGIMFPMTIDAKYFMKRDLNNKEFQEISQSCDGYLQQIYKINQTAGK